MTTVKELIAYLETLHPATEVYVLTEYLAQGYYTATEFSPLVLGDYSSTIEYNGIGGTVYIGGFSDPTS